MQKNGGGDIMHREDHILWKLTNTYDLLYNMRKKFARGDISRDEYIAMMEPKCMELIQMFIHAIEKNRFLEWHQNNIDHYTEEGLDPYGNPKDKYGQPFKHTSKYVIKRYNEFMEIYYNIQNEKDLERKMRELVIGLDSFVGWMHGSFELSIKVMREYPITGDLKIDYNIALHTMYLLTYKNNAGDAIEYLREKIPEKLII